MRIDLEISELQAFIAVAEKSSFRAAAEGLFISQPALSRRIEKLEETLQARLLERTTRRVSLTEAGRQFLGHAKAVVEELQAALHGMEQRAFQRREHVTVACIPSVVNHLLPAVLGEFSRLHPAVHVTVIDESALEVLASVKSGDADFGIDFVGAQEAEIDFKALHDEPYVVVVRDDHRLAGRKSVDWAALAGEKLVSVSPSSANRVLIDNAFARVAQRPVIQYEINHVAGAISLVAAGLGVAVLPALALASAPYPALVGIPLTDPVITRTLGLITRKGSRLQPAAKALAESLEGALRGPGGLS